MMSRIGEGDKDGGVGNNKAATTTTKIKCECAVQWGRVDVVTAAAANSTTPFHH